MTGDDQPPSLEGLDARLKKARQSSEARGPDGPKRGAVGSSAQFGLAMRIGTEMVAAVVVSGAIGWLLDRALGSGPWLFLVFLLLGVAAGVLSAYRTAIRVTRQAAVTEEGDKPD